ncbi:pyruvate formate-lyase-activating protein [Butyrivibrio sp. M55]|uniref:pyruvate formate-lyase-activating protein n=1 Tax=Butyrivibrio sp. M55 TaxID=1855323 RepID=UPI0008E661A9|nr:pyruvate formate-lyase-activating protein [Butyrivibrio sp. M55]SFU84925.1 pyruvate formate lyase activating enzyme [Butyrivibrio sp. M55]
MVKGAIHSIETFGSVDGPGIRFIVFLKGCKLRCKYCHNADTWDPNSEDMRTPDELLDFAERYRSYWGTEGGITVSGGEPLLQIDFLIELFKKAKERGINTCIDTALQPFTREEPFFSKFEELMKYTDLLLVDIKHIDRDEHIELTGLPNDNIFDGFKYLSEISKPIWIRHVLVPGITDDDEYLKRTREFIETLSNVQKIEVLPYHSMGQHKFETLGIPYKLDGVKSPSKERVENAMKILNGK